MTKNRLTANEVYCYPSKLTTSPTRLVKLSKRINGTNNTTIVKVSPVTLSKSMQNS